ncbi:MAG: SDR family oxidoreductase [Bryobacteraceae bacterium]
MPDLSPPNAARSLLTDAAQAFRETEILLAGANGFLGKVILGFLLDRYSDFRRLHILVRPKGNMSAEERFYREVLASPALAGVVDNLEPGFLDRKIRVIPGDLSETTCGLSLSAVEGLAGKVGLILNCAGLVEFFPPVDDSFKSNVDGVENVVALAKRLKAKLLHVSTCYVCGEADGLIEETTPIVGFYPRRKGVSDDTFDYREEIRYSRERVAQIYRDAGDTQPRSKEVAQRLIELGRQRAEAWGWVNTYTYAKSIGEQIIADEKDLDYAIVRPAIVESALHFPFPGWVEGGRTAAPLVLMAMGGLKHWTVRPDAPLEVVPVDLVASSILAVSALLLEGRNQRVYQLGTADVNPLHLEPLVQLLHVESKRQARRKRPQQLALVSPGRVRILSPERARVRRMRLQKRLERGRVVLTALKKVLETTGLPGRQSVNSLSMLLRGLGLQAMFREQTLELYQPFILDNRYIFESQNIRAAYRLLSERDRELLPWTPELIDWERYWVHNQIRGVEKWVKPAALEDWAFKV